MPRTSSIDPRVPQRKKSARSGAAGSVAAILVVLFSLGYLPQINNVFASANASLQAHNDTIVSQIVANAPAAALTVAILGLAALTINGVRRRGNRPSNA